jgi:hypothetical protein
MEGKGRRSIVVEHNATNQKVAGSRPDEVDEFVQFT